MASRESSAGSSFSIVRNVQKIEIDKEKIFHQASGDYLLLLGIGGKVEGYLNHEFFTLDYGQAFFCKGNSFLSIKGDRQTARVVCVYFDVLERVEDLHEQVRSHKTTCTFLNEGIVQDERLERIVILANTLLDLWQPSNGNQSISFHRYFYELLDRLQENDNQKPEDKEDMELVLSYIDEHYQRKIRREELARVSGMSLKRLSVRFKETTGQTFTEYVNTIRINKAKEKLLLTNDKLSEIAAEAGFKDEFYLSRKFKQSVGVSPLIYKKRPKKFASLDHAFSIDLLTLGVVPHVALTNSWINSHFANEIQTGQCYTYDWGWNKQDRYRLLMETKPDVIIDTVHQIEEYDRLKKIAPVIQIPWRGISWRDHFRMVAEVTEQEREAAIWLERFDEKVAYARTKLLDVLNPSETVAIFNCRSNHFLIYGSGYMGADLLYRTLHLTPPCWFNQGVVDACLWPDMMDKLNSQYNADHIFFMIENTEGGRKRAVQLMNSEEWQNFRAVRNNQVYFVSMEKWYGYGPAAIEAQLEEAMRIFTATKVQKYWSNYYMYTLNQG
ncbi:AraC family transcriptional regulator [Ornithinibacillus xuwenensis]|uniref:AraC family transcriptional regulator n=1 Tax=Ornithinibacillus xuwenensis TaxID=3144668 RepID=A0ABU9XIC5_9BACI